MALHDVMQRTFWGVLWPAGPSDCDVRDCLIPG
jgi:hypothetical protein